MSGLHLERLLLSSGPIGLMQSAIDAVISYVKVREQFDKPLSSFQLIQSKLADLYVRLHSARAYTYSVARAADQGYVDQKDCSGVYLVAAENAVKSALDAIQCLGGNG